MSCGALLVAHLLESFELLARRIQGGNMGTRGNAVTSFVTI